MRRETDSVADIVIAAHRVVRYVGNLTQQEFEDDEVTHSAVMYQLEALGEAVKRLSGEFRARHADIPWHKMVGTRNVLILSYDAAYLGEAYRVAAQELPPLIVQLELLLPPPPEDP